MKMMKNWIALLLALCMMAALGVASACCTEPTGMEEPQTTVSYTHLTLPTTSRV